MPKKSKILQRVQKDAKKIEALQQKQDALFLKIREGKKYVEGLAESKEFKELLQKMSWRVRYPFDECDHQKQPEVRTLELVSSLNCDAAKEVWSILAQMHAFSRVGADSVYCTSGLRGISFGFPTKQYGYLHAAVFARGVDKKRQEVILRTPYRGLSPTALLGVSDVLGLNLKASKSLRESAKKLLAAKKAHLDEEQQKYDDFEKVLVQLVGTVK